ncbi:MAG: hypothetical protein A2622_03315 [Bdellovibrionales bacterium RIFCSPHIGHO2_01_FULL_40_29]|nr:MAG: hypothetical protein A2622_03315 [Bdellovibrionales bacterium RIFCSPHIGHO2_01_FULL_40_29]OFZ34149.1 MAG: hypothetical protein A3D17_03735 [Bdellovibrionales bacterium RIFCSPHIGHO2_02_FULL_40_15]
MTEIFKNRIQIKFHQADPAGIMYFAQIFTLAHDSFELFIQKAGFTWTEWFQENKYLIPIRHAESDFQRPFLAGQFYEIEVTVAHFSTSSFQMQYTFKKNDVIHAVVKMIHTCLDKSSFQKINLPEDIKTRLSPFLKET